MWPFKKKAVEPPVIELRPRKLHSLNTSARMFEAAKSDRMNATWGTTPLTADQIVEKHLRVLVARSREQAANNDYAKSFLRMCRQNIVGSQGVTLQAQSKADDGKLDSAANDAIEREFAKWAHRDHCDVTGQKSWARIQRACVLSAAKDGEFFVRKVFGKDAGKYGFALQVLDPQRCPVELKEDLRSSGTFIRCGIEFNRYGRPLAYYFSVDQGEYYDYSSNGRNYVRIPADEIIHGFVDEMVGQKRGLPWMATGLFRMRQLGAFEDAAIINARIGAAKMGFIQFKEGQGPEYDEDEELTIDAEPGTFPVLPPGAEVKEYSPQYPSGEYGVFTKSMLRSLASGFGVLYNNLASDLEGVNFSSIRQGTLDERDAWKDNQEWLVETLCQPVFEAWLPRALLAGHIKAKGKPLPAELIDRYAQVTWQPRRWPWIDPRADVDAAETSKNNLLVSPSQLIREQGKDPQAVWSEHARDFAAMVAAYVAEGIDKAKAEELVMLSLGRQPPKPQAAAPKEPS
jgi:lambda family phage portal protein